MAKKLKNKSKLALVKIAVGMDLHTEGLTRPQLIEVIESRRAFLLREAAEPVAKLKETAAKEAPIGDGRTEMPTEVTNMSLAGNQQNASNAVVTSGPDAILVCDTCKRKGKQLFSCPNCTKTYCNHCRTPHVGHYKECQFCGEGL